jgi:hypothetical protein
VLASRRKILSPDIRVDGARLSVRVVASQGVGPVANVVIIGVHAD